PIDSPQGPGRPGGAGGRANDRLTEQADFTTVQSLNHPLPPIAGAGEELLEFLLTGAGVKYSELKEKAAKQEPLPSFTIKGVKLTFNLEAEYQIVRTQYTRNVVGVLEGTDPKLKETYVTFGAHYDHVGYSEGEIVQSQNGPQRQGAVGRVKEGATEDRIWNGADDDGSGTAALLGVAKAFATGPRPKRSLMFLWYAGEERGLWGSRYYVDYPSVPLDQIVANLNMDMVGRNRDDKTEEANSVYLVGSDRISTELHNLTIEANTGLTRPLKLDFELNDPTDLEQVYYRSDHYSYAARGIPVVFFTTGLHPDYHANTDSVEKINFEKMTRISQLVYETGLRIAGLDHTLARDNRGPRVGKGSDGKIVD
ncbi:MAG TPA: M28 family peptidase, partial [Blastocatellia bacterium]|nr:M28 family peptidase [Blastocatellia bacterium]